MRLVDLISAEGLLKLGEKSVSPEGAQAFEDAYYERLKQNRALIFALFDFIRTSGETFPPEHTDSAKLAITYTVAAIDEAIEGATTGTKN